MKNSEDHLEQGLELTYKVKIKTFGKPSKIIDDIGQRIAQVCGLNFADVEVIRGKTTYRRATNALVETETTPL